MNAASPFADFDYELAFSRNLGLVQPGEQARLRDAKIAIAGLGAVGGMHLLTLARMGIGHFHIADLDHYELANFNRQVGATIDTVNQPKVQVMEQMAAGINPSARITRFDAGIQPENIERFLEGIDVAVDGLDYFAVEARDLFYRTAHARGIPVVAAGPLGCSAALLVFVPGGMTWQEYFAMDLAKSPEEQYVLFAIGTAPRGFHFSYIDTSYVNLREQRGPSLALAVQLCAGVVGAEVLKLLLKRGPIYPVPGYQQFDAYKCRYGKGKLRWGNRGPIQRLKFALVKRRLSKHLAAGKPEEPSGT
jgi:molybdopterin/thiamine biosynthesis adenylyltransferase